MPTHYSDEEKMRMEEERKRKIAMTQAQATPLQQATAGMGGQIAQQRGMNPLQQAGLKLGSQLLGTAIGGPFGTILGGLFNRGTASVPQMDYGPDPLMMKGGGMVPMKGYQQGVDSVPAMLTPGEAVIPAPAAQNPANQPAIQGMIQQGRDMQDGKMPMQGQPEMSMEVMDVSGPLSGKTKREQLKLMQDMSLKKKSWMAEEKRKDEKHNLAMKQTKMKGALAMKQSQE